MSVSHGIKLTRKAGVMKLDKAIAEVTLPPTVEVPMTKVKVGGGAKPLFSYEGEPLLMSDMAKFSLLNTAKVPAVFAGRCTNRLLGTILREFKSTNPLLGEGKFLLDEKAGEVTQFLHKGSSWIPTHEILETIQEAFPGGRKKDDKPVPVVHRLHTGDPRDIYISLAFPHMAFDMAEHNPHSKEEDLLYGGITIRHHPSGNEATSMDGYFFRLVCSNGMILRSGVQKITRHISGSAEVWKPRMVAAVGSILDGLEGQFDVLTHTAHQKAPKIEALIDSLKLLTDINDPVIKALRQKWEDDPPQSLYDAINHLTMIAHQFTEREVLVRRVEALAGTVLKHHKSCMKCGRLL